MTTTISPFVQSLTTVRQDILAAHARAGLYQVGLRLRLPEGVEVPADHHDAGKVRQGLVEAGEWEIFRLDNTPIGRVAVLLRLPAKVRTGPGLYDECFAHVRMGDLRKFEAA